MRQTFRQEEAEQILREAVRRDVEQKSVAGPAASATPSVEVSAERLREMAEELGVSTAVLETVLRDRVIERDRQRRQATEAELRRQFINERKAGFAPHLYSFLGVNALLFCIWLLTTPGGYPWFVWPLLGWGLGLYLHAAVSLPTRGAAFEHSFGEWQEARRRRAQREAKKAERNAGKEAKQAAEQARRDAEAELDE